MKNTTTLAAIAALIATGLLSSGCAPTKSAAPTVYDLLRQAAETRDSQAYKAAERLEAAQQAAEEKADKRIRQVQDYDSARLEAAESHDRIRRIAESYRKEEAEIQRTLTKEKEAALKQANLEGKEIQARYERALDQVDAMSKKRG